MTVPIHSGSAFGDTVNLLTREQIVLTEMSLHLPSLDEVFFSLTGKPTETSLEEAA
jgi:oleandomycin transport system ATP-binding protein